MNIGMTGTGLAGMLAVGLAVGLAAGGCSRSADIAPGTGPGGRPGAVRAGRTAAPKPPADPMAGAKTYVCADDQELHVVFAGDRSAVTVRLADGVAAYLPRKRKDAGVEAYSNGDRTLGISTDGDMTYSEAPAPPEVCRKPDAKNGGKDDGKNGAKDAARSDGRQAGGRKAAVREAAMNADLPAPKADGVTRNFTAADKGKTIDMTVGEKVSVSLVGIPTAGYVWGTEAVPSVVKVSDGPSGPTVAAQNQPGYAGGNHWQVVVVEAVRTGEGELTLAMRRPWETHAEPDAETFAVRVRVK